MNKRERISDFVRRSSRRPLRHRRKIITLHFFSCGMRKNITKRTMCSNNFGWWKKRGAGAFLPGADSGGGRVCSFAENFEQPSHAKHGRRLRPATRLFALALRNLEDFPDEYHALDLVQFRKLLLRYRDEIIAVDFKNNPWSPETAPRLALV